MTDNVFFKKQNHYFITPWLHVNCQATRITTLSPEDDAIVCLHCLIPRGQDPRLMESIPKLVQIRLAHPHPWLGCSQMQVG